MKIKKIVTKNKAPVKSVKKVNKNPPLVKREYIEIPNIEFKPKDKVKLNKDFDGLYNNIDLKKSYNVLEFINSDLGNMNCGVIYLKEYPTQPFVSHHFVKV